MSSSAPASVVAGEMEAGKEVMTAPVTIHDRVGNDRADDGHDNADDDLGE